MNQSYYCATTAKSQRYIAKRMLDRNLACGICARNTHPIKRFCSGPRQLGVKRANCPVASIPNFRAKIAAALLDHVQHAELFISCWPARP